MSSDESTAVQPTFADLREWEWAEVLMQPVFIRLVDQIRKHLDDSAWQSSFTEVSEPVPGYRLCLEQGEQRFEVDLWDLCYRVCCQNYPEIQAGEPARVDRSLIEEAGDIDWHRIDQKASAVISQVLCELNLGS